MAQRTSENKDGPEKGIIIRSYGYDKLVLLYFPNITKKSATTQLRRWIHRNLEIYCKINHVGFAVRQRLVTPRLVNVVIQFVGEL
jgi:hypothetical protein